MLLLAAAPDPTWWVPLVIAIIGTAGGFAGAFLARRTSRELQAATTTSTQNAQLLDSQRLTVEGLKELVVSLREELVRKEGVHASEMAEKDAEIARLKDRLGEGAK